MNKYGYFMLTNTIASLVSGFGYKTSLTLTDNMKCD